MKTKVRVSSEEGTPSDRNMVEFLMEFMKRSWLSLLSVHEGMTSAKWARLANLEAYSVERREPER